MITVEDVKAKMNDPVYDAEVVTDTEKAKKPFYKKPVFWLVVGIGSFAVYKLATKGKNGTSSIEY